MAGVNPPREAVAFASFNGAAISVGRARAGSPAVYSTVVVTLALDTSTPDGSVAVRRDGAVVYARGGDGSRPHGMRLPGEALVALEACGLTLGDVTLLAVGLGPGPFT